MPWKKHKPNNSFLNVVGLEEDSNHSSSIPRYALCSELRRPFGGSMVILIPPWRIEMGKSGDGHAVSHSRNAGFKSSGFHASIFPSRIGMYEIPRWQFCSRTHFPLAEPSLIPAVALGPCPCPREIMSSFLLMPIFSANVITSPTGSLPDTRMKISGVMFSESANDFWMSKVGGSTNFFPICAAMNCTMPSVNRDSRIALRKQRCSSMSSFSSHGPGIGVFSASIAS
mmetsp:Transcript_19766/g.49735  ORF Transcript_19766/g.49735 Transcript_19766/m.49735 type:complete len:227 (-) Transcript_19766:3861-4541(-)